MDLCIKNVKDRLLNLDYQLSFDSSNDMQALFNTLERNGFKRDDFNSFVQMKARFPKCRKLRLKGPLIDNEYRWVVLSFIDPDEHGVYKLYDLALFTECNGRDAAEVMVCNFVMKTISNSPFYHLDHPELKSYLNNLVLIEDFELSDDSADIATYVYVDTEAELKKERNRCSNEGYVVLHSAAGVLTLRSESNIVNLIVDVPVPLI